MRIARLVMLSLVIVAGAGCGYLDEELFVSEEEFQAGFGTSGSGHGVGGGSLCGGGRVVVRLGGLRMRGIGVSGYGTGGYGLSGVRRGAGPLASGERDRGADIDARMAYENDTAEPADVLPASWGKHFVEKNRDRSRRISGLIVY